MRVRWQLGERGGDCLIFGRVLRRAFLQLSEPAAACAHADPYRMSIYPVGVHATTPAMVFEHPAITTIAILGSCISFSTSIADIARTSTAAPVISVVAAHSSIAFSTILATRSTNRSVTAVQAHCLATTTHSYKQ